MSILSRSIRMRPFLIMLGLSAVAIATDPAMAADFDGAMMQGGLVIGRTEPGAVVRLDGADVAVTPGGRFVFGFGRDQGPSAVLTVRLPDGAVERHRLRVAPQQYQIERVDGLPPRTVTIPPEEQERRLRERSMVGAARAESGQHLNWLEPFFLPAEGRISGRYGSQRVLNGEPRTPHFGLDIAAPVGTIVRAPAGGRIVLAEPDFLLEGGLIIIDHGYNVYSSLLHLSSVIVTAGQEVQTGDEIGAVGATGRATGPHVDWRINWGSTRVDPALIVDLPGVEND